VRVSVLIVIPTYNEVANLPVIVQRVRKEAPSAHLLIVDDTSPDGTGELADQLASKDPAIHVLHRREKDGLGRAYVAGFEWGLARNYDVLVQMDGDLSHNPSDVPRLVDALESADLVLGSRYVTDGGTVNWGVGRQLLSRGGSFYARTILGLPIRDVTGGFKAWKATTLRAVNLATIRSNGYSFQVEMTYRVACLKLNIQEVPIIFADRVDGVSKMSKKIVIEAMLMVWRLRFSDKKQWQRPS
jgi:dolichol-phosphate mannosyltransferase